MYEEVKEIKAEDLDLKNFIGEKIAEISSKVGDGYAINALSGGVDSSTVTMFGYKALGDRLKTYFIDTGLMRENEPQQVVSLFEGLGVSVEIVNVKEQFFYSLKGIKDPEEKREAITQTFYKDIFAQLVRESRSRYLLQGTILTDINETSAGIKRQHNVFEQIGIDPEKKFGYKIIEPLKQLRKEGVIKVAEALGLPESIYNRMPFPGPGLSVRVIGEVTPERIETVRRATSIVEEIIGNESLVPKPFQYMAILHEDKVTGIRYGKRDYGLQIEMRCWDSIDARIATPTRLPYHTLDKLAERITKEVPGVVSVTYNITGKPHSTIEAV
ncbi:GMP synthase [glutamine-hydrolyzing] [subsurface metagenome]